MTDLGTADVFELGGLRALVTGASSGLGLHFARVLHGAGCKTALAARSIDKLQATADELGAGAAAVVMDVTHESSVREGFAAAEAAIGPIDILVNNAGLAITRPILDHTIEDWDQVMDVNLRGAWIASRELARRCVGRKAPASIVNVASILGLRVAAQVPAYVASKAALDHLTRAMAVELARYRIRVNSLAPGYVETDINRAFFESEPGQAMIRRVPQRRLGQMEDLSVPLLLLASSKAGAHMTGATLVVDGGHSINSI